ncbi:MAG TPA: hypothetical protein VKX46_07580 [Ktedonobacteraceae bacterium]|nr:hypothetical protein [Ktedonobacteraceae bacterium]
MPDEQAVPDARQAQRQQLQQTFGDFYMFFVDLLATYDPIGLIKMGAPKDEYDIEADAILLRIHEAQSARDLGAIIYEEFVRCFSLPPHKPQVQYLGVAQDAWRAYQRWLSEQQRV